VSENTVAQVMREQHLAARRRRRRRSTTRPGKGRWRAPDLVKRDFPAADINQKWYGDGTEIPAGEGKLHLASVLDMGSRRVLGFAQSEHHDAQLAYGALAMAVAVRGGQVPGVILHTDQGSEYTARAFRAACRRLSIAQSMGRPGSALDNSVIAPVLGLAGLLAAIYLSVHNFDALTGVTSGPVTLLPWLIPLAAVIGFGVWYLNRADRVVHVKLEQSGGRQELPGAPTQS
jgi:transposase InsO family protein